MVAKACLLERDLLLMQVKYGLQLLREVLAFPVLECFVPVA